MEKVFWLIPGKLAGRSGPNLDPWDAAALKQGGLGAEIAALINEKALTSLEAPVMRVCGFNTIFPLAKLENYYLPGVASIMQGIKKVMSY